MKSSYISDLQPNQLVKDALFLVRSKEIRQKKTGEPYLSLVLGDRTGEVDAKMWDNVAGLLETFERDDFVRVKGLVQVYQNRPQLTLHTLVRVADGDVDPSDYFAASKRDLDEMLAELRGIIAGMRDPHCKALLESIFADEDVVRRYRVAPAAKQVHHAYLGGLIEHVLSLAGLARFMASHYKDIDLDLLLTGVILHDLGKIYELSYSRSFSYTTEGQLLGHIVIGLRLVDEKIRLISGFPDKLRELIEHLILSHHGELEFGSPKVPLFAEAILLHFLDNLDSKMDCVRSLIEQDRQIDGFWTNFSNPLSRPILKKVKFMEDEAEAVPGPPPVPPDPIKSAPKTLGQLELLINSKRNP